eukprot:4139031-Karenia_brevis.AAC.1
MGTKLETGNFSWAPNYRGLQSWHDRKPGGLEIFEGGFALPELFKCILLSLLWGWQEDGIDALHQSNIHAHDDDDDGDHGNGDGKGDHDDDDVDDDGDGDDN